LTRDETAVDSRTDQEEEEQRWNEEDEEDEKQNRENEEDEEVYSDDQGAASIRLSLSLSTGFLALSRGEVEGASGSPK
jgi:hypothetical protein